MATVAGFADALLVALEASGVQREDCQFDASGGQLVIAGATTRVVPVSALFCSYAACKSEQDMDVLVSAAADVFVNGAADVPAAFAECGPRLLPQLWPLPKIAARLATLPSGHDLPHCGLHGEEPPLQGEAHTMGVVLVCDYVPTDTATLLPAIETPVLSSDLSRWGVGFCEVLHAALENLRARTKAGPSADKRWEHHQSGCGQMTQADRFDAARAALFPKLVATRKRTDGVEEQGGHVVYFATTSCVLATTSKNALGLCFMGDIANVEQEGTDARGRISQVLSSTPYRLLKKRSEQQGSAKQHPLNQKAGEGLVWRWLPYAPGGPPLKAAGEFSVPIDRGEVDAILAAIEAGRSVPVFTHSSADTRAAEQFAAKKEEANSLFKAGSYLKAIAAYDAALATKPPPSDADAAIAHANASQACLRLAEADESKKRRLRNGGVSPCNVGNAVGSIICQGVRPCSCSL
jgi:hypothetical protein